MEKLKAVCSPPAICRRLAGGSRSLGSKTPIPLLLPISGPKFSGFNDLQSEAPLKSSCQRSWLQIPANTGVKGRGKQRKQRMGTGNERFSSYRRFSWLLQLISWLTRPYSYYALLELMDGQSRAKNFASGMSRLERNPQQRVLTFHKGKSGFGLPNRLGTTLLQQQAMDPHGICRLAVLVERVEVGMARSYVSRTSIAGRR